MESICYHHKLEEWMREWKNIVLVSAVARIYSGFTVMGTRALGQHGIGELENKDLFPIPISLHLELVSKP